MTNGIDAMCNFLMSELASEFSSLSFAALLLELRTHSEICRSPPARV